MANGTNGAPTPAAPPTAIDLLDLLANYRAALVELLAIVRRDGGYMPADTQLRLREIERLAQADGARVVQPQLDGEQPK